MHLNAKYLNVLVLVIFSCCINKNRRLKQHDTILNVWGNECICFMQNVSFFVREG